MPGVSRAGDAATCAHTNSGSNTVFANGKGISMVGASTAGGGVITGPGISTVLVQEALSLWMETLYLPMETVLMSLQGLQAEVVTYSLDKKVLKKSS